MTEISKQNAELLADRMREAAGLGIEITQAAAEMGLNAVSPIGFLAMLMMGSLGLMTLGFSAESLGEMVKMIVKVTDRLEKHVKANEPEKWAEVEQYATSALDRLQRAEARLKVKH